MACINFGRQKCSYGPLELGFQTWRPCAGLNVLGAKLDWAYIGYGVVWFGCDLIQEDCGDAISFILILLPLKHLKSPVISLKVESCCMMWWVQWMFNRRAEISLVLVMVRLIQGLVAGSPRRVSFLVAVFLLRTCL